jgi:L-iditol 2-dehydrogenase
MKKKMKAAVYIGEGKIEYREIDVPKIGPEEALLKVAFTGLCKTDIKKITNDLLEPPRIFGHEIVGKIVRVGSKVENLFPGERVAVFHHVPCLKCFFCLQGLYSQCKIYQTIDTTAGFGKPSGGGFAEYVKLPALVVNRGIIKIPKKISYEEAVFIEPTNCCLKAVDKAGIKINETVLILGQGPIGLTLTQLSKLGGAKVVATDLVDYRLRKSKKYGADYILNANKANLLAKIKLLTEGRGADKSIVAVESIAAINQAVQSTRPGGKVIFFFDLIKEREINLSPHIISHLEVELCGSYSSAWDLHDISAELIFNKRIDTADMITHIFPLKDLSKAVNLAKDRRHVDWNNKRLLPKFKESFKILIKP